MTQRALIEGARPSPSLVRMTDQLLTSPDLQKELVLTVGPVFRTSLHMELQVKPTN